MFFSRGVTPSNLSGIKDSSLLSSSTLQSSSTPSSSKILSFVTSEPSSTSSFWLGSSSSTAAQVATSNTSSAASSFSGAKKIANGSLSISSASYRKFFLFAALSGLSAVALWWAHKRYYKKQSKLNTEQAILSDKEETASVELEKEEKTPLLDSIDSTEIQQDDMAAEAKTKTVDRTDCQPEDCTVVVTPNTRKNAVDTPAKDDMTSGGYKTAESPSTNSEGSADSGRATGGLTSASPFDAENTPPASIPTTNGGIIIPYYEFEIPNSLVGLIIGVGGKTIKELCMRTGVKMLIRPHHTLEKLSTHQICSVEGKRENINRCLHMIKGRFPKERFPDLNLKPVIPPVISPTTNQLRPQIIPLTLPVGVPCEVFVSSTVDPGHFFVQLPTHPSFSSLEMLNCFMLQCYGPGGTPELPRPINSNVICAAPAYSGWFRALIVYSYPDQDEVLVKFVDYGGYARIPAADLRQIRTDFLSYPMQAVECHLAYVEPVDGTTHWSDEAGEVFQKMCGARIIQAEIVGFSKTPERIPYVVLYFVDENKKACRIDNLLLEKGLAKMADPTRMEPATKSPSSTQKSAAEPEQ